MLAEHLSDRVDNGHEGRPSAQESTDRHLVRGVEDRRSRTPSHPGPSSQVDRRKGVGIERQ